MDATGRTARDLAADLSRRISLFQREIPQVTVTVTESKSRRIFVLGAVLLPGSYAFGDLPSVWEAIAEAGGPAEDAQLSAVEVIPGDLAGGRATQVVDVATIIRENRMDSLPRLQPGDTVRVPRGRALGPGVTDVYIFGAIGRQGSLPIDQAGDLVTALIRSGGPAPDADLKGVEIVRKSGARVVRLKVSMENYLEKANTSGNPPLEPGDTIYVRRSPQGGRGVFGVIRTIGPVLGIVSAVVAIAYGR
jgi:protein involved in polysaccharide export with SLBB domain